MCARPLELGERVRGFAWGFCLGAAIKREFGRENSSLAVGQAIGEESWPPLVCRCCVIELHTRSCENSARSAVDSNLRSPARQLEASGASRAAETAREKKAKRRDRQTNKEISWLARLSRQPDRQAGGAEFVKRVARNCRPAGGNKFQLPRQIHFNFRYLSGRKSEC